MATDSCLVLYGNSVFLAGIKAELQSYGTLELITLEAGDFDASGRIGALNPQAVIFDLAAAQPDFAVSLLREQPGVLLIGVDPSSDELLVMSSRPAQALSVSDLVEVIQRRGEAETERKRQDMNLPKSQPTI